MYGFETITMAPIDRNAIDVAMLTEEERVWLNAYHARVREALRPMLKQGVLGWLEKATAPI
jgi:Xaa-Pro aminopeptidase